MNLIELDQKAKKVAKHLIVLSVTLLIFISCNKPDVQPLNDIDFSKLIGKVWKSGSQYLEFFQGDSGLVRNKALIDPSDTTYIYIPFTWHGIKPDTLFMENSGQISKSRVMFLTDTTVTLFYPNFGVGYISK